MMFARPCTVIQVNYGTAACVLQCLQHCTPRVHCRRHCDHSTMQRVLLKVDTRALLVQIGCATACQGAAVQVLSSSCAHNVLTTVHVRASTVVSMLSAPLERRPPVLRAPGSIPRMQASVPQAWQRRSSTVAYGQDGVCTARRGRRPGFCPCKSAKMGRAHLEPLAAHTGTLGACTA